jgi:hypothetical protein
MRNLKKPLKGFTLLEIIIYAALVGVFLTGAISLAWNLVYAGLKSSAQNEVTNNLNLVSKKLTYEIKNAESITINNSSSITIESLDSTRNEVTFFLDGQGLMFGVDDGGSCSTDSPCLLTGNKILVTDFSLEEVDGVVNFEILMKYNTNSSNQRLNYESSIYGAASVRSLE